MSDDYIGVKKLAAEILRVAAEDFKRPRRCARETRQSPREIRNECARFLASNSVWHMVLGLNPEYCARWLRKQVEGVKRV